MGKGKRNTGHCLNIPAVIPCIGELCNIPVIACNGAYMYDLQKEKIVLEEFLPEPEISRIAEAALAHSPGVFMRITCEGNYLMENDVSAIHTWLLPWKDRVRLLPYDRTPHGNWHKIAWTGTPEELTALRPVIDENIRGGCVSMLACPTILEVQAAKGTKGAMLPRLKTLIGKENSTLWAIGDYENDYLMLKMADRRAMPANGIDKLRTLPGMVEVCDHDKGAIAGLIAHIERELKEAE